MTMMSDILQDLLEEVLCRVPITSLRAVRRTCKRWNDLSKDPSFLKKYCGKRANEFLLMIMRYDLRASLMSINLHGIHDNKDVVDPFIKQVNIYRVFHCDGLLLCVTSEAHTRLVVWNPCLEQTRWIQPINKLTRFASYGIGYDNKNNNQKILRLLYEYGHIEYQIYNLMSNSWRVSNITTCWNISYYGSVSLKGNTYFIAKKNMEGEEVEMEECLLCFDFTNERFGPLLLLPFHFSFQDRVILSTVREEQLAVLFNRSDAYETKIWITTKIEPNAVSWSNFLKIDFKLDLLGASFFVDKEEKVAVICCIGGGKSLNNTAYMIGEDGYYKEVDLGESYSCQCMCTYVPSCVQVQ